MAGEIQLNSTTMATESSGSITAELDTIRPNTTNGSLTLQGDSSNAGVTGLTIDSSGNATFAGTGNNVGTVTAGTIGSGVVFPAGHIINFASNSYSTATTITSTTNGSGTSTGLSVGITPSSTSNLLLILVNIQFYFTSNGGAGFEIYDGSSVVYNDSARDANFLNLSSTSKRRHSLQTVINPSSSGSEITYTVRAFKISGTFICQDSSNPSTISICEIKQ